MLAVICALKERRCYLEGSRFTIVTDHQPNTYLDVASGAHTLKRRARWLDVACGYDYTWCYRPGRVNVADPVSRAPQHFAFMAPVACAAGPLAEGGFALPTAAFYLKLTRAARRRAADAGDAQPAEADRPVPGPHISDGGG